MATRLAAILGTGDASIPEGCSLIRAAQRYKHHLLNVCRPLDDEESKDLEALTPLLEVGFSGTGEEILIRGAEKLEALAESLAKDGCHTPVYCRERSDGKLDIVDKPETVQTTWNFESRDEADTDPDAPFADEE